MFIRDSLDTVAKIIYKNQTDYTLKLINKNPESLGSLFILYQYFGRQPILDPFEYFSVYENLSENLSNKYPDFEHVGHLKIKVNKTRLAIKEEEEIKSRLIRERLLSFLYPILMKMILNFLTIKATLYYFISGHRGQEKV